jgi:hypothetical protein
MPNSDPIRIGEKTWGTGSTLIAQFSSAPPSDWDASTFVDWRPFPGSAMLIGWNGNSSGDGILGGAAPGGIGVWGVVGSGETTPVPGDCGVYGTAISTGVSGFASGDVTGSGTGVAGMGKVGGPRPWPERRICKRFWRSRLQRSRDRGCRQQHIRHWHLC